MNTPFCRSLGLTFVFAATLHSLAGELADHKLLLTSVRTGDTEVFIADPTTGDLLNVSRSPKSEDRYPCWSPDGKQICFMSDREGTTNLWVSNADGSKVRRLNRTSDVCYMPSWQVTPRGERIVFGKHGAKAHMASIKPDGSDEVILGEGHDPTLSPDGKLVCYTGIISDGGVSVFVMNHDGTNKRQVVKEISKVGATFPNWSPDSKQIVYSFPVGDALELFIINLDGTGQRQLTKFGGTSVCTPSAWSPDGAWISFRKTDERYWSNKERMLKIYSEKPADKRPVWLIRPDGSDAQVIEALRFQMAIDGSRASWKPQDGARGATRSTTASQFTLVDKTVRFLPAAPTNAMPPGTPPVAPSEWTSKYPDPEINHYGDGFRIAFIDPKDSHYIKGRDQWPGIPANWRAPVNYFDGTIYYRVEVLEKPDEETLASVIMRVTTEIHEGTHNVWFGHGVCTFRERGVHYFQQPVHAHRPFIRDTRFNFEKPLYEMQLVVADSRGAVVHRVVEQVHNKFQGSPNLGLYLPLKVRYSAVVVAKGEKFESPAWW